MLLVYCLIRKPEELVLPRIPVQNANIRIFLRIFVPYVAGENIYPLPSYHTSYGQQTDRTFIFP